MMLALYGLLICRALHGSKESRCYAFYCSTGSSMKHDSDHAVGGLLRPVDISHS